MQTQHLLCQVFKSAQHPDMYLYVKKASTPEQSLQVVPDVLKKKFGKAQEALLLLLKSDLKLAAVDVNKVIESIREKGFYLQMPTPLESEMREVAEKNTKLW